MRTSHLALVAVLAFSARCLAQMAPPFYSGSATAFEPEVATAFGGSLLSVSATVSSDQKYVTIGAQPTLLGAPQLHAFSFAVGGSGFVGFQANSGAQSSVLSQQGMTLVAPLRP
ncbi:MAG TPA: hypothetical protein VL992_05605 [Tepidisphaeraceae bacterium]|nr:hypothetical protein [Tepidisphaeraceae bacterium]